MGAWGHGREGEKTVSEYRGNHAFGVTGYVSGKIEKPIYGCLQLTVDSFGRCLWIFSMDTIRAIFLTEIRKWSPSAVTSH